MKSFVVTMLALLVLSCNKKAENVPPAPTEITHDTTIVVDAHNSRNSLDYIGIYKATLPCADCEAIEALLQLSEDFSYTLTYKYVGKKVSPMEQKGTFVWNDAGNGIILDNAKITQYLVGENKLIQLDGDGNRITGPLAKKFEFEKLPESQAVKTDAPLKEKRDVLEGTRWRLAQLKGKAVSQNPDRELGIDFRSRDEFSAYAGCNSIGGKFRTKENKIKFTNVFSTKMMCGEIKTEEMLLNALNLADNYVHNAKMLQLRQGETVLAQFDPTNKTK